MKQGIPSPEILFLPQHFLPSLIFHSSSIQKFQMEYNSFHQFALYSQNIFQTWTVSRYLLIVFEINVPVNNLCPGLLSAPYKHNTTRFSYLHHAKYYELHV